MENTERCHIQKYTVNNLSNQHMAFQKIITIKWDSCREKLKLQCTFGLGTLCACRVRLLHVTTCHTTTTRNGISIFIPSQRRKLITLFLRRHSNFLSCIQNICHICHLFNWSLGTSVRFKKCIHLACSERNVQSRLSVTVTECFIVCFFHIHFSGIGY